MKNSFRFATTVASLLSVAFCTAVFAQSAGTNVAILDVGKVFKEHVRFTQAMEIMKEDVKKFESYLRDENAKMKKMVQQLGDYTKGSKEHNDLEASIAKRTSDLQVETQLKRREFMQREAKLYFNTYTELTQAVKQFAEKYGVQLVLRFSSEPIKEDDAKSILQGVNATVVYHNKRDITNIIVKEMNRGSAPGGVSNRTSPIPGRPSRN